MADLIDFNVKCIGYWIWINLILSYLIICIICNYLSHSPYSNILLINDLIPPAFSEASLCDLIPLLHTHSTNFINAIRFLRSPNLTSWLQAVQCKAIAHAGHHFLSMEPHIPVASRNLHMNFTLSWIICHSHLISSFIHVWNLHHFIICLVLHQKPLFQYFFQSLPYCKPINPAL